MSKLKLSDELSISTDVLAQTQAIVAIKGAGKSYAAMKMMEESVRAGFQSVALDPTGIWWGISADGDGVALPVLVMGGEHGNVPLESTSGEVVAEFVVDSGQSVVLDLSLMRKAEMHRFMAAFLDKLYHYKATHRENLHVFFDEADTAAPQSPGPEQARVLGAAEDVVRRGRSRGLGMTLITQRPAVLNKNLLEMCDTLYVMRVIGSNDQDAIRKRLSVDADSKAISTMMDSLASLSNGEAWIWSPAALGLFKRFKFGKKQTFDSGRSPKPGERMAKPKARADVDLEKLTARIKATVDRAKENDPKALRAELAKVRADLVKLQTAKPPAAQIETKTVEKFILKDGQLARAEAIAEKASDCIAGLKVLVDEITAAVRLTKQIAPVQPRQAAPAIRVPAPARKASANGHSGESSVGTGGLRRILIALAQRPGLDNRQIGLRAGLSSQSGTFSTYIGRARGNGWIRDEGDRRFITDDGLAALGDYEPLPSGSALLDHWLTELGNGGASRMLRSLAAVYPNGMTNEQLGEAAEISHASGTFSTYLGRMRGLELIQGRGVVKASDELFD